MPPAITTHVIRTGTASSCKSSSWRRALRPRPGPVEACLACAVRPPEYDVSSGERLENVSSGERLSWGRTAHARHASTGLLKVEEQWEQQRCSVFEVPEGQANGEQGQADVKYTPVANDVTEKFFTF